MQVAHRGGATSVAALTEANGRRMMSKFLIVFLNKPLQRRSYWITRLSPSAVMPAWAPTMASPNLFADRKPCPPQRSRQVVAVCSPADANREAYHRIGLQAPISVRQARRHAVDHVTRHCRWRTAATRGGRGKPWPSIQYRRTDRRMRPVLSGTKNKSIFCPK